jgi:hypothetical protein
VPREQRERGERRRASQVSAWICWGGVWGRRWWRDGGELEVVCFAFATGGQRGCAYVWCADMDWLCAARLRTRLASSPTKWYPIPISLGIALLVVVNFYKQRSWEPKEERKVPATESQVKVKGPWQVRPSHLEITTEDSRV